MDVTPGSDARCLSRGGGAPKRVRAPSLGGSPFPREITVRSGVVTFGSRGGRDESA